MAMKTSAPPKPRAGTQRSRPNPRPQRVTPISRSTTPVFRASTPSRQQTPSDGTAPQKNKKKCPNPNCENPNVRITDDMQQWVCQTCGTVAAEMSNLVSETGFQEGQGGRITAMGVTVGTDQTHQRGAGRMQGTGMVGQETTSNRKSAENDARALMRAWLVNLRYSSSELERGMRFFGLAWTNGFVRGRRLPDVAIVSLYIALRSQFDRKEGIPTPRYPVMLMDLAELQGLDVFHLGAMFQELVRRIYIIREGPKTGEFDDKHHEVFAHGPEILIPRFVQALDFPPDSEAKIKNDAIKIVQRMNRDWMTQGRRPAGVSGAAVVLAARMNNHRRSVREVMLMAKVTEVTLNKRLEEFSDLPSSKLSVNAFRDDSVRDAIGASDPPAYTRNRLGPKPPKKRGRPRKLAPETAAEIEGEDSDDQVEPAAKRPRIDAEGFAIPALPNRPSAGESSAIPEAEAPRRTAGRPKGAKNWRAPPLSPAEQRIEEELQRDIDLTLEENAGLQLDEDGTTDDRQAEQGFDPQDESQTINEPSSSSPSANLGAFPLPPAPNKRRGPSGPRVDTNIGNTNTMNLSETIADTEFDDDPDVANCLLTEPERELKERIWVTANEDWLRQDHAKRIKKQLYEAEMKEKGLDPAKYTKDGRKKLKGSQFRTDGSRRAGRWGDVSYLNDPVDLNRSRRGRAGSNAAEGEGGTPTAEVLAERGGDDEDGENGTPMNAGEAVAAMLAHRSLAYTSSSRRIDPDAIHKLYGLDSLDSSSQASDDADMESVSSGRRGSRMTSRTPSRQQSVPQSILRKTKHSASAMRREANKKGAQGREGVTISSSPDAAGPSQTARTWASQRTAQALDAEEEGDEMTLHGHLPLTNSPTPRPSRPISQPQLTTAAATTTTSQPHTPNSTSTISILDDGSVEEVVGEVRPSGSASGDESEDGEGEEEEEEIQIRSRSGEMDEDDDEDDEDDPDDYVNDDEVDYGEGGGVNDLDDAFAGIYRGRGGH